MIKREYGFGAIELVLQSPRFGVMLLSMCLSIAFIVVDILSVISVFREALPVGLNPFWKVSVSSIASPFLFFRAQRLKIFS